LRSALLFSGLIACSIALALFWTFVGWVRMHPADLLSRRKIGDEFELVCDFLVGVALVGALIGKGRGRTALLAAAVDVYLLVWGLTHLAGGTSVAYLRSLNTPVPPAERVIALEHRTIKVFGS